MKRSNSALDKNIESTPTERAMACLYALGAELTVKEKRKMKKKPAKNRNMRYAGH